MIDNPISLNPNAIFEEDHARLRCSATGMFRFEVKKEKTQWEDLDFQLFYQNKLKIVIICGGVDNQVPHLTPCNGIAREVEKGYKYFFAKSSSTIQLDSYVKIYGK